MQIVDKKITLEELKQMSEKMYYNLVKVVVDIEKEIIAVDGALHADEEALLLQDGSSQENLWGINLYPAMDPNDWIEFDSIINIRPFSGNRTRGVDDPKIQNKIKQIINKLVSK